VGFIVSKVRLLRKVNQEFFEAINLSFTVFWMLQRKNAFITKSTEGLLS